MEIIDGSDQDDEYHVVGYETGSASNTFLEFDWDRKPGYISIHEANVEMAEISDMLDREIKDYNDQLKLENGDEWYE